MTDLEARTKELDDAFKKLLPEMKRCITNAPIEKRFSLRMRVALLRFSPRPLREIPEFLRTYA